jgi:hypothetical protein
VDDEEKKKLNEFVDFGDFKGRKFLPLKKNQKDTIYITLKGLTQLAMGSKQEGAEALRNFILKILLPSISKHGAFDTDLDLDTSYAKPIYKTKNFNASKYKKKRVVYFGAVGTYKDYPLYKFGSSGRVVDRDMDEHKKDYGEQFTLTHIFETDNNQEIETLFKNEIKTKKLDMKLKFNGKNRDELFVLDDNFNIEDAEELMEKLIDENQLDSLKEKDQQIKSLGAKSKLPSGLEYLEEYINMDISVAKEITKHKEEITEHKKIELQMEKEKTRRLELELELRKMGYEPKTLELSQQDKQQEEKKEEPPKGQKPQKKSQSKSKAQSNDYIVENPYLGHLPGYNNNKKEIKIYKKDMDLDRKKTYNDDQIKELLNKYFECTEKYDDVIFNRQVDVFDRNLGISKPKIIKTLKDMGGTKYKSNKIEGVRRIALKEIGK